jgi:tetratricopeptide (TPR) repeat protein
MSLGHEHEMLPLIRDWLAATRGIEVAVGLSSGEARRRALEFLDSIESKRVVSDAVGVDDDLKDTLWGVLAELDERPIGPSTLRVCNRVYQFVSAVPWPDGIFEERSDLLHGLASVGWRSAPGGVEAVLRTRAELWEHGDEKRHQETCESAVQIPARIERLRGQEAPDVAEVRDICSRLSKLTNISPALVADGCSVLYPLLSEPHLRVGWLDDREFFKAATALASGMGARVLGRWHAAKVGCARAVASFRRTVSRLDLDRVGVEQLTLQYAQGNVNGVVESAPELIETASIPRERIKARLTFATALVDLNRPAEAVEVLEAACGERTIETDPALWAYALLKLGNALSAVGREEDATANFARSGEVLARFHHPVVLAGLTCVIGEHFGRRGDLCEAARLYATSRNIFREVGQAQQVAYLSVLLAELLMLLGKGAEAESELLSVLPVIESLGLRREALVAVSLLRKATEKRRTDLKTIQALRKQLGKLTR